MQKTDPQLYKLLEVSYEAWTDSGIDVRGLRDSNRVGVYTGLCGSEVILAENFTKFIIFLVEISLVTHKPAVGKVLSQQFREIAE